MRSIKIAGLCLVAVFAFSAVAVASASAEQPTFKTCGKAEKVNKKYTGGYNNSTCSSVNATNEGEYAAKAVAFPAELGAKAKSKTTTLYFSSGGKVLWKLVCKKDKPKLKIGTSTGLEGTIELESCAATNEATHAKAVKCSSNASLFVSQGLLGNALPSGDPGILLIVAVPAYECAGVQFVDGGGYTTGTVASGSKGVTASFKANASTGEQEVREFESEETGALPTENFGEVKEGSSSQAVEVAINGEEPLSEKGIVVIG